MDLEILLEGQMEEEERNYVRQNLKIILRLISLVLILLVRGRDSIIPPMLVS